MWKTLGYVPDSEDDTTPPPEEIVPDNPREFVAPPLQPLQEATLDPDEDSELSDLSSLSDIFDNAPDAPTSNGAPGNSTVYYNPPLPDSRQISSRRLRHRQEVQKHPYTIEYAQYRRALQERGVASIQVVTNSQRENDAVSPSPASDAGSSALDSRSPSPRAIGIASHPPSSTVGGNSRPPGSHRQKRRRVVQSESDSDTGRSPNILPPRGGQAKPRHPHDAKISAISSSPNSALRLKWYDSSDPGSDAPPVPLRSSHSSTPRIFKSPDGMNLDSTLVPTSQFSTTRKPAGLVDPRHAVISSESDTGSVSEDEEDAVERVGRRLKGVLPRSWVRLELQKQVQQPSKTPKASRTAQGAAGIARTRQISRQTVDTTLLAFDSDATSKSAASSPTAEPRVSPAPTYAPLRFDDEPLSSPGSDMEHDIVDLTVSGLPRAKRQDRHLRQQRLTDLRPQSNARKESGRIHGQTMQPSKSRTAGKPRGSKFDHLDQDVSARTRGPAVMSKHRPAQRRKDRDRESSKRKHARVQAAEDAQNMPNDLWTDENPGGSVRAHRRQAPPIPSHPNVPSSRVSPPEANRDVDKENHSRNHTARQKSAHFRTAQLESLESEFKGRNHRSAFHTSLLKASSNYKIQSRMPIAVGPGTTRYQSDQDTLAPVESNLQSTRAPAVPPGLSSQDPPPNEAFTTLLGPGSDSCRQSSPAPLSDEVVAVLPADVYRTPAGFISGLDRTRSVDFGINRLPDEPSTVFGTSTFIGSGELETAMLMNHRDLDVPTSEHVLRFAGKTFTWTAWDQDLIAGVKSIFQGCRDAVEEFPDEATNRESVEAYRRELEKAGDVLRQILVANSHHLYFLDPIDRESFCSVVGPLLKSLIESTVGVHKALGSEPAVRGIVLHILVLEMTLAVQLLAIRPKDGSSQAWDMISLAATAILQAVVENGLSAVRTFIHASRAMDREISQHETEVESVVAVHHLLKRANIPRRSFWDVMHTVLEPRVAAAADLAAFDVAWLSLFTILPILDIGARGELSRDTDPGDWKVLKVLVDKAVDIFKRHPGKSMNNYIRTILHRCYTLVQRWRWKHCEGLIGATFDFFSTNKLAPLHNEVVKGSPAFLSHLDGSPSLEVMHDDHSFGIFLKLLSVALINLKQTHPPEKVDGIIWRCVPNHNRRHGKEDDLREADLDALRNHHDLLCTLFWHASDGIRPRLLRLMQDLVDHGVSHQEVCRLNVNTWLRIARLLLLKPGFALDDLSQWFQTFADQAIAQYRLARMEIEDHSPALGRLGHSKIEQHIKRNQRPVLDTILTIVTAMKLAVKSASSKAQVAEMLKQSSLDKVLSLSVAQQGSIVSEIMLTFSHFVALPESHEPADGPVISEESQEFGDWPEEVVSIDFVKSNVFALLSNILASEQAVDDAILLVVNTWAQVISTLHRRGEESLAAFLDPYQELSWHRLNGGDLHRIVSPYFYAQLLHAGMPFDSYAGQFLTAWASSLVEREAYLRFQHSLTSAILNTASDHPVLVNLPFAKAETGQYELLRHQLKQRRLALLSSILSNMQASYDPSAKLSADGSGSQQYLGIIKGMMSSMKTNFTEIKQYAAAKGDDSAKGKYVEFVHAVVGLLQQHTSGFCAIDPFFTDSTLFPLPANDPAYAVGKLRSYAAQGDDPSAMKRLTSFFQTMSERAAIDQQQQAFTTQLELSMLGGLPGERRARLWGILIDAVFPAYLDACISRGFGGLFAPPVLMAMSSGFDGVQYLHSETGPLAAASAAELATSALAVARGSAVHVMQVDRALEEPGCLRLLACAFRLATSTLPCLDYASRQLGKGCASIPMLKYFKVSSMLCAQILTGLPRTAHPAPFEPPALQDDGLRTVLTRTVTHRLESSWLRENAKYCFTDNGRVKTEIKCSFGTMEDERNGVVEAIEEFHDVLGRMTGVQLD